MINKANSVPLANVAKKYGVHLDDVNKKIICPFPGHKGGRESTASFYYYPDTNSFWCFGCKVGIMCCDFVAEIEKISRLNAANKILMGFAGDVDEDNVFDKQDFPQRLEVMMKFSKAIRDKISTLDEEEIRQAEYISKIYDSMCLKHELSNEALSTLVDKLIAKLI